ncbi:NACHT domain-containing protein [Streptomyces sp. NPDC002766]|uniref:NACHT domain-containing protein n=1 Tax=Streptomyces sp. NPDC002766 TaxID=3154429 RepID=UPI003333A2B1
MAFVGAVVASCLYAVIQVRRGGMSAADTVTVLGFPLAVAGIALAVMALRKPSEGTEADLATGQARTLARLVAEGEGRVLAQLLGADTARINLSYTLVPASGRAAQAPSAGATLADVALALPDIAAYYRSTRPARLVITGAAGAGKTVLGLELMLALVKNRAEGDPVPVRVPLAGWDTKTSLRQLLLERLVSGYGRTPDVAANLVDHHLVLPVLDGLDEMDALQPTGLPDPQAPRARAALALLSAYQDAAAPAPLVLTCRSAHYDAFVADDTLADAARITITPVGAPEAVAYLAARTRNPARWQLLLDHLTAYPASPHASLLSTPWRLCLTATVYARADDPTELLAHGTADDLDRHLLARYIAAVTAVSDAGGVNRHRYTPAKIHKWLHHLAVHLAPTNSSSARSDIVLHQLWPMAGRARVRITDALLTVLACCIPLLLALAWTTAAPKTLALIGAGIALSAGLRSATTEPNPVRIDLRGLTSALGVGNYLLSLAYYVLIAAFVGQYIRAVNEISDPPPAGWVMCGALFGLLLVIPSGLVAGPSSAATPRSVIRQDAQFALAAGPMAGVVCGLTLGLLLGPIYGLTGGLIAALVAGLVAYKGKSSRRGVPRGAGAARRYLVFLLCAHGKVPFRLATFLDWSCETGLMRYSGTAYQFRHRELQMWLTAHPSPTFPGMQ